MTQTVINIIINMSYSYSWRTVSEYVHMCSDCGKCRVLCNDKLYTICCCSDIADNRKVKVYVKGFLLCQAKPL